MRRLLTAAALTALTAFPAFADMRPGMYQITATTPGMPQPQTQAQCMTPQDAKDPITPLVTGGDPNCTFSNKAQTATRFTFDYACQAQGQRVTGHVDFAMTADSFQGTIMANGNTPQGPRTVTTTLSARRTGDCRVNASRRDSRFVRPTRRAQCIVWMFVVGRGDGGVMRLR